MAHVCCHPCPLPSLAPSRGRGCRKPGQGDARCYEAPSWQMAAHHEQWWVCQRLALKWSRHFISHKRRWAENGADEPSKSQAIPHLVAMRRSTQRAKFFSTALMCSNPLIALGARQQSPFKIYPFGVATTSLTIYLCLVLAEAVALFAGLGLHLVPGCS